MTAYRLRRMGGGGIAYGIPSTYVDRIEELQRTVRAMYVKRQVPEQTNLTTLLS
jgi:hypothetical protein